MLYFHFIYIFFSLTLFKRNVQKVMKQSRHENKIVYRSVLQFEFCWRISSAFGFTLQQNSFKEQIRWEHASKFIPGVSFQSFVFFVYCFISILLNIFFWVYSDGDYASVINASNSSSPTCCLISLFCTLNLFQKSSDKSSL